MKIGILAAAATFALALVAQAKAEIYSFYFDDNTTGDRVQGLIYGLPFNSPINASPNANWDRASAVVITSLPDPFNGLGSLTVPFTVQQFTDELFDGVIYHNRWVVRNGVITYGWYQTQGGYFDINCEAVPGVYVNSIQAPPFIPFNPVAGVTPDPVIDRGVIYNTGGLGSRGIHFARVVNPVPEPSTWAMMMLGFGGMGALLRRRKAAAA